MTKRGSPEADLQKMCLQWLSLQAPDVVFFHVPNEHAHKRWHPKHGMQAGVADVHILWREEEPDAEIWPNLSVLPGPRAMYGAIEFKAPRKAYKTTPEQDEWLETVQRLGHKVAVCDDFERFQELMRKWGVI